jgi:hypothetical protein
VKVRLMRRLRIPVLTPNSKLKLGWDFLVMMAVFYKFFSISIHICFFSLPISKDIFSISYYHLNIIENIFLVLVMFFDIVLTLNMAYYENGIVVNDKKLIKDKYLKTHFIFDLLPFISSMIQLLIISLNLDYQLRYLIFVNYILFIPKYKDLSKTWSDVEELFYTDEKKEALFSLLILFFVTLVSAHVSACIWHGIAFWFNSYVTDINGSPNNWLTKIGIQDESWGIRYLNALYFSVTTMITVGYGDVTPANEIEKFFCILNMLSGCIVFGYAINKIGVILDKIGKINTEIK